MSIYRINYSITGAAKYISHLDVAQVFDRSFRRAGIALAFSEGFNPHPKFSFGSALAVGVSSNSEYLDVELREDIEPTQVVDRLKGVLPEGFAVREAQLLAGRTKTLMAVINRAVYQVRIPLGDEILTDDTVNDMLQELLAQERLLVIRQTKKGKKERDIRGGIHALSGQLDQNKLVLEMTVTTGSEFNVRPEEVVQLVIDKLQLSVLNRLAKIHREGLYVAQDNQGFAPPWEG